MKNRFEFLNSQSRLPPLLFIIPFKHPRPCPTHNNPQPLQLKKNHETGTTQKRVHHIICIWVLRHADPLHDAQKKNYISAIYKKGIKEVNSIV